MNDPETIRRFLRSNELSEVYTGDMPSEDRMMYYIFNPEQSAQPDAARRQQEWWTKGRYE